MLILLFFLFKWNRNSRVLHVHILNEDKMLKPADNSWLLFKKMLDYAIYSTPHRKLNSSQPDNDESKVVG
jgi:hypothetical protein